MECLLLLEVELQMYFLLILFFLQCLITSTLLFRVRQADVISESSISWSDKVDNQTFSNPIIEDDF